MVDLHIHTNASDGTLSPAKTVERAKRLGLKAIAITDHDTIDGIEEAQKAGELFQLEVIPGIEISVDFNGEMHILGYYINSTPELKKNLIRIRESRIVRDIKMIDKLRSLGIDITLDEVEHAAQTTNICRPHIASVMKTKGYVESIDEAFEKFLGEGKKAYVERERISPEDGIKMILNAGGIPVLAHPRYLNLCTKKLDSLLYELKAFGLKGIEAYYSMNTVDETGTHLRLAIRHNLLVTGGSDFHGENRHGIEVGKGKGNLNIEYEIVDALKTYKMQNMSI